MLEDFGVDFGFHALRAGAATTAAQAGVPEQSNQLAANGRSDSGGRPYIRPQWADQRRSDALGTKRKKQFIFRSSVMTHTEGVSSFYPSVAVSCCCSIEHI